MCFNYLSKNGPDKIKRAVTIQGYESGGLRMTDISQFINALKISWIEGRSLKIRTALLFIKLCTHSVINFLHMAVTILNLI